MEIKKDLKNIKKTLDKPNELYYNWVRNIKKERRKKHEKN